MLWVLGSTGKCALLLVGSRLGVGRNIGQANGEGIRQGNRAGAGGAETRMSREQAGILGPAFQAVPLWLCSRFPSCFSAFPVLRILFFPPLVGSIAEQIEDLLVMYIFGGAGQDTSNQTPS